MPASVDDNFSDGASTHAGSRTSKLDYTYDFQGDLEPELQQRLFTWLLPNKRVPPIPLESERKVLPLNSASFLSRGFLAWIVPLLSVGYKRTIMQQDLWTLGDDVEVKSCFSRFSRHLDEITAGQEVWTKNSIARATWRTFPYEFYMAVLLKVLSTIASCLTPLMTKNLIQAVEMYIMGVEKSMSRGVGYAFGVAILILTSSFLQNHSLLFARVTGIHTRGILAKALLDKSLESTAETRHRYPGGNVLSFLGSDLERIEQALSEWISLFGVPISFIIGVVLLVINLHASALIGIAVFLSFTVIIIIPTMLLFKLRDSANKFTDKRSAKMREVLQAMRMIKLYSWEDAYEQAITAFRTDEMKYVFIMQATVAVLFASAMGSFSITPMAAVLASYAINGQSSAANIFSSLSVFSILSENLIMGVLAIPATIDGFKSGERISKYLQTPSETPVHETFYDNSCISNINVAVQAEDVTFYWNEFDDVDPGETEEKHSKHSKTKKERRETSQKKKIDDEDFDPNREVKITQKTILRNVNLAIDKGEFVVITGRTGSGKSSLISGLSGFMPKSQGRVGVSGSSLLCGSPMVLNATIKDNILFGKLYNSEIYKTVIRACALQSDLEILPAGDMTEVGERGVTLSGGQKARVNLARAVYNDRDIYFLDDILSAVDSNVGKHILENCVLGLLEGKTRVLATHNLAIIERADRVIFINGDGTVQCGTAAELLSINEEFASLMAYKNEPAVKPRDLVNEFITEMNIGDQSKAKESEGQLVEDEERAYNSIPLSMYFKFFISGSGFLGPLVIPIILFLSAIAIFTALFNNVWLTYWIEDKFPHLSNGTYIGIYTMLGFMVVVTCFFEIGVEGIVIANASKVLNLKAVHRIMHVPMSYMDSTPVGRILNRFTKDTNTLDNEIGNMLKFLIRSISQSVGTMILAIIYVPWFALSVPFFFVTFICLANFFQATSREVKRLEAVNRSFVLNNLNEILNGLDTIRSYGSEKLFADRNDRLVNRMNEVSFVVAVNQRWINLSLSLVANGCVLLVCLLCATHTFKLSAGSVGLLTNYMVQFAGNIANFLDVYTQVENHMNSVERIIHYAYVIQQEAAFTNQATKPADTWPEQGSISFKNVQMRYRPGLPLVLHNLSIEVSSAEKIGVCGRTGAGKSSLMSALFRLMELDGGSIHIDGVDISKLGLHDLRSILAIIPQDPVLFQGTIRSNLDPFGKSTDDQLWDALRCSGLTGTEEKRRKFALDAVVEDGGDNFSLGECQLIALARALLRKAKILVLDEATSSVDHETDSIIQATIRREFKNCTVLCIAHRLKTIIDYDKVLVLEKGELEEFDKPERLFFKDGRFRQMCNSAGITADDFNGSTQ